MSMLLALPTEIQIQIYRHLSGLREDLNMLILTCRAIYNTVTCLVPVETSAYVSTRYPELPAIIESYHILQIVPNSDTTVYFETTMQDARKLAKHPEVRQGLGLNCVCFHRLYRE